MKYLVVFFLFIVNIYGGTVTMGTPDAVTAYSARVPFTTTDTHNWTRAKYDIVDPPVAGATEYHQTYNNAGSLSGELTLQDLKPSTTYYVRICINTAADNTEICPTSSATLTTSAAPADRYTVDPPLVSTIPTRPTSFTTTYTVDGDCNGGATDATHGGFQAMLDAVGLAATGTNNYEIKIPAGMTCDASGAYTLKARSGTGRIVIHTDDATKYPPAGVRNNSSWNSSAQARIRAIGKPSQAIFYLENGATNYTLEGLYLTNTIPSTAYKNISSVVAGTYTSSTAHGLSTNSIIQLWDADGDKITNAKVTVSDSTHFTISASTSAVGTLDNSIKFAVTASELGTMIYSTFGNNIDGFVIDRVHFKGDLVPVGITNAISMSAQSEYFILNSTFENIVTWAGRDPVTGAFDDVGSYSTPVDIFMSYSNKTTIQNCEFKNPGIELFSEANTAGATAQDLLLRRNKFNWSTKYFERAADFDGLYHVYRQAFEFKNFTRAKLIGNDFRYMYNKGITGGFSQYIVITPRPNNVIGSPMKAAHIEISYNKFTNGPGVMNLTGSNADGPYDVAAGGPWKVQHNIAYAMDGNATSTLGSDGAGNIFATTQNLINMDMQHNTTWKMIGDSNYILARSYNRSTGTKFAHNLINYNFSTTIAWGNNSNIVPVAVTSNEYANYMDSLKYGVPYEADGTSMVGYNYFIPGVVSATSGALPDYATTGLTTAGCQSKFSGDATNLCAAGTNATDRFAAMHLRDPDNGDFRPTYLSPHLHAGLASTYIGADQDAVEDEMGIVKSVQLVRGSPNTTLEYKAPTGDTCFIEAPNNSTAFGTGAMTSDGGGARKRAIAVTMGGNTYVRLHCPVQSWQCTSTGGPCTLVE